MSLRVAVCLSIGLMLATVGYAQEGAARAGSIFSIQGTATIQRSGGSIAVVEGATLQPGDEIVVGEPGRVAIELPDGSYIRLSSGSRMKLPEVENKAGLLAGALHFLSHSESHPVIETQQVTAAIRGTEFTMVAGKDATTISMFSGSVEGTSPEGRASVGAGQGVTFKKGKAPEIFSIITSDRSVQWSMFVPFSGDDSADTPNKRALDLFRAGKTKESLAALVRDPKDPCHPDTVLRGRILVAGGDPQGGAALLERCAQSSSRSSARTVALSTLSSVRIMEGNPEQAASLAEEAVRGNPNSTSARIAQSFAYQERGDLDGALRAVEEMGTSTDPDILARRAEVLFMFGRVPEARALLESLPRRSWYAETVYGFVLMADRSFAEAESAFNRAAAEEPGAGLPRVGLGIVKVNRGELAEARQDFERATMLEPSRGLYRSYLAKDYFEADSYDKAEPEYARAIELDPRDPTPYLYRSFMRVAQNDMVGALEDIGTARKLSGERDVYRSQLLLDQDSAMQSASVARVYRELGFRERGRIEAITALSSDYMNPTAHRLLSQTQEDIFSADLIASEQRISNLFAPLSINLMDSIGTGVSLNEYSQLFERDGWRTAIDSGYDSKNDFFSSGVLSAYKNENVVLGLSASGAARDGITDDPRTSAGTMGFSFQAQPSWADRFLVEGRGLVSGSTNYDESNDDINGTVNAAYLHRFSPETSAVLQSSYDRDRVKTNRPGYQNSIFSTIVADGVDDTILEQALLDQRSQRYETTVVNEAQVISKQAGLQSIFTLRQSTSDLNTADKSLIADDESGELTGLGATLRSDGPVTLNGTSVSYLGDVRLTESLHTNLGGEYERVEWASQDEPPFSSDESSRDLLSPKAGFVYRPDSTITLRTGYGESLGKGTRIDLISIEPTLIGGIAQRYNDLPGTRSQNLGFGADFHPRDDVFFGAEWTRRWLDENRSSALYEYVLDYDQSRGYSNVDLGGNYDVPIGQDLLSSYGSQVIDRHWVAGVDYRYVRQDIGGDDPSLSSDHRGKLFSRYFFSNGFFLQSSAAYRYQDRSNVFLSDSDDGYGRDGAWLFGGGVGYRLPVRQGILLLDVQNIFGQDVALDQTTYFNEPVFNDPTVRLVANFNF